jgi:nucleoside phosphorylase
MKRSLSVTDFKNIRRYINIIIATAVPVESKQVRNYLRPIASNVTADYAGYRIGYFGNFLAMHVETGKGGNNASSKITEALSILRMDDEPLPIIVIMPGIACGLQRHTKDITKTSIVSIKEHLKETLDTKIEEELFNFCKKNAFKIKINLPRILTPEKPSQEDGQFLGDIMLASSIIEYDFSKNKPQGKEIMGSPYTSSPVINTMKSMEDDWVSDKLEISHGNRKPRVHVGFIAAGDQLIRSFVSREELKRLEVIGAEMEGHGLGNSTHNFLTGLNQRKAQFIFAKAICDWGVGKNDDFQIAAAKLSVSFLEYCLQDVNIFEPFIFSIKESEQKEIENALINHNQINNITLFDNDELFKYKDIIVKKPHNS